MSFPFDPMIAKVKARREEVKAVLAALPPGTVASRYPVWKSIETSHGT